jgi:hypothetical protein
MQILIFVCLCAGSWASLEDDKLSLLQRTVSRRSRLISPDTRCEVATSCKIALSKVTKNDLDKGGEIRYSEACVEKGEKVDLVVTTTSDYVTKKPWLNGLKGPYGNINLNAQTGYDFTFSFYKSGTTTPVEISAFHFTIFDIDGWYKGGSMRQQESVTFFGSEHFLVGQNCELHRQIEATQSTFTATTGGGYQDNPKNPMELTSKQLSRSVTFFYKDVSSFKAKFEIKGYSKLGTRNFMFAGESAVSTSCTAAVCPQKFERCDMEFTKVIQNNLGGKGPQTGAPELRYEAVCTVAHASPPTFDTLDLAVTSVSDYVPAKSIKNGIRGKYGTINLMNSNKGDWLFSFYKSGTNIPYTVGYAAFSIFDIDSGNPGKEIVTLGGYKSFTVGNETELLVESSGGSLKLTSTTLGIEADNPSDPMALTVQQRARSVTFDIESAASFPLTFEITNGDVGTGRNLLFAGSSSLTEMCLSSKP